ncbi:MAG: aryl-sulfate sulfotransferase [Candidatus Kapabacteria bacterium]|nr:aryl-sulfate sulfotransferase [Candidatus Kapabacteria bacterium]
MKFSALKIFMLSILIFGFAKSNAEPDFNVDILNEPAPGYLIFNDVDTEFFSVVDNYGYRIFPNENLNKASDFRPINDKYWISFSRNVYYIYNFEFEFIDSITNPTNHSIDFHDMLILKNGRILMLLREQLTIDMSEIVPDGQKDATILSNVLVETDKTGQIYWQWRALDHLNITDVTSRINLTQKYIDLTHANSMDEDETGNILISFRHYDQIIKVNRQTGNIIWKMGGSESKGNQFTFVNDTVDGFFGFSHQHTASFLANGNILLYDNGNLREPQYSRAVEYSIDEANMKVTKVWEYRYSPDIYQAYMGSAFRLPNGNTLINWGRDKITEVRYDKSIAFELDYGNKLNYRAYKVLYNTDVAYQNISGIGDYDFSNQFYNTGIKLSVSSISGSGQAHFQRHKYAPSNGTYSDSIFSQVFSVRWVFGNLGIDSISGQIRIKATSVTGMNNPKMAMIYKRDKEAEGEFTALNTSYDLVKNEIVADFVGVGEFVVVSFELKTPVLLSPISGSGVFTNVELENQQVAGAELYQIQLDTKSNFINPLFDTLSETNINKFEALNENTKYFWRVRAMNQNDTTAWSNTFWFLTEVSAPFLISPENEKISVKKSDSLIWTNISGLLKYQVQVAVKNDFLVVTYDTINTSNSLLIPHNLEPDKLYYWRVRAIRETDTSFWSEVFSFKTAMNPPFLTYPKDNANNVLTSLTFAWTPSKGTSSYSMEISETNDFENIAFNYYGLNQTKWYVSDLLFDKKYFWRIRAVRATDSSDWSSVGQFSTVPEITLDTPELILPLPNSRSIRVEAYFEWEEIEGANNYHFILSEDDKFSQIKQEFPNTSETSIKSSKLDYGMNYYWRVAALNNSSSSLWTPISTFLTELESPKLTYPINGSTEIPMNLSLVWELSNTVSNYQVQISLDESFENTVLDRSGLEQLYLDCELNSLTKYFVRIRNYNDTNESRWSNISSFTTSNSVSVSETQLQTDAVTITNYPNPFTSSTTFTYTNTEAGIATLKLFDIYGNQITTIFSGFIEAGTHRQEWHSGNLNSGVYYYQLLYGNNIKYGHLIIIN